MVHIRQINWVVSRSMDTGETVRRQYAGLFKRLYDQEWKIGDAKIVYRILVMLNFSGFYSLLEVVCI